MSRNYIQNDCYTKQQGKGLLRIDGGPVNCGWAPLKVEIYCDSYDFQSFGRLSRFNDQTRKWESICHIPYSELEIVKGKKYYKNMTMADFEADSVTLFTMARKILNLTGSYWAESAGIK